MGANSEPKACGGQGGTKRSSMLRVASMVSNKSFEGKFNRSMSHEENQERASSPRVGSPSVGSPGKL